MYNIAHKTTLSMKKTTFLQAFRAYIRYHAGAINKRDRRQPVTIQGYCNKYLLISRYLSDRGQRGILCRDFRVRIARDYLGHLMNNYGHSHNYAARCADICSTVMSWAVNEDLADHNPLNSFSIPKDPPKKPVYFTTGQIAKWEQYRSPSQLKQKAADLFTLIMHTGFDYGDLYEVGRQHLTQRDGIKYLIKPRHKNGNEAIIPLSPVAEAILERYDYKMRQLSNPKLNEAIKQIADEIGINVYLRVKDGRKIFMMDKLNNKGYSIEATSRMGGHNSIRTTEQTYAQVAFNLVHSSVRQIEK